MYELTIKQCLLKMTLTNLKCFVNLHFSSYYINTLSAIWNKKNCSDEFCYKCSFGVLNDIRANWSMKAIVLDYISLIISSCLSLTFPYMFQNALMVFLEWTVAKCAFFRIIDQKRKLLFQFSNNYCAFASGCLVATG